MWPDWVSNPGLLTYQSGALPTAARLDKRKPSFELLPETRKSKKKKKVSEFQISSLNPEYYDYIPKGFQVMERT